MAYKHLTFQDRKEIADLYAAGTPPATIAEKLGFHRATIYRELERGYTGKEDKNHRPGYDPEIGQRFVGSGFQRNRWNEKPPKAG